MSMINVKKSATQMHSAEYDNPEMFIYPVFWMEKAFKNGPIVWLNAQNSTVRNKFQEAVPFSLVYKG